MNEKLSLALKNGTLKPYDLLNAQIGDKVALPFTSPCEVIAIHNGEVVLGQVGGVGVYTYDRQAEDHQAFALPIAWLDKDPLYAGTTLYSACGNTGSWKVVRADKDGVWVRYNEEGSATWVVPTHVDDGAIEPEVWTLVPPTININGHKVPQPVRVALAKGTEYFLPDSRDGGVANWVWVGDGADKKALKVGVIHLTKEAALKHAEALLFFHQGGSMNHKIIRKAYKQGLLKEYDLASAKVGDKVLGLESGEVLVIYGDTVVFGWQCGEAKSVTSYRQGTSVDIYLAPLCWVEEKPVYAGDTLYRENGKPVMARKLTPNGEFLLFSRGGSWRIDGSGSKLTWEPPQEDVFEVEGKPLKVGDVVFSRDGDEVTVEAFEMGYVITTPGQVMGTTQWTTDRLHWTDPTILGEVEGKPVRKGDVLYGTWHGSQTNGYVIDGILAGSLTCGGIVLASNNEELTWTKPKPFPLNINGHVVPAPERVPPEVGTTYWVVDLLGRYEVDDSIWSGDSVDERVLGRGLVHLTKEAALAHAKALLSFS